MSHQENNYDEPEEELTDPSDPFEIPFWLKIAISMIALILIVACVCLVTQYVYDPKNAASPNNLGLNSIFLFSITAVILVWIPWQRLGIKITKIGGIEFGEIAAKQASEHAEDLTYLQDRIESLEENARKSDSTLFITEHLKEPELRDLLIRFLTTYNKWAFSPSRIKAWGVQQQGFSELAGYDHPFIRTTLQKMVAENILETRVSKQGNTLFRIPKLKK